MIAPLVERGSAPEIELLQLDRGLKERMTELNSLTGSVPRTKASIEEAKARLEEVQAKCARRGRRNCWRSA